MEFLLNVDKVDFPSLTSSGMNPGMFYSCWKFTNVLPNIGLELNLVGASNSK